jgi:hypothetical protein
MGSKVTIALADGLRVEDSTENGMLESGEPEDRNCLEKTTNRVTGGILRG